PGTRRRAPSSPPCPPLRRANDDPLRRPAASPIDGRGACATRVRACLAESSRGIERMWRRARKRWTIVSASVAVALVLLGRAAHPAPAPARDPAQDRAAG